MSNRIMNMNGDEMAFTAAVYAEAPQLARLIYISRRLSGPGVYLAEPRRCKECGLHLQFVFVPFDDLPANVQEIYQEQIYLKQPLGVLVCGTGHFFEDCFPRYIVLPGDTVAEIEAIITAENCRVTIREYPIN